MTDGTIASFAETNAMRCDGCVGVAQTPENPRITAPRAQPHWTGPRRPDVRAQVE